MRVLIFGKNGTIGRALTAHLQAQQGVEVLGFDRRLTPLANFYLVEATLRKLRPNYVYNLATAVPSAVDANFINGHLPALLAAESRSLRYRFIHTSSVLVFDDRSEGPFGISTKPNARQGYGLQKRRAEDSLARAKGDAIVFRLGWQIDDDIDSNNMTAYLERQARTGPIAASRGFLPSCSLLPQTVAMLWRERDLPPGLYQANANRGHSLFAIAHQLKQLYGKKHWRIVECSAPFGNQLMHDDRLSCGELF